MATRNHRFHDPKTRAIIQAGQLVKVLQDHALSDDDKPMMASRLKAIEILLRKTVPDLSATELTGDPENPIGVTAIERTIVDPKASSETPDSNS